MISLFVTSSILFFAGLVIIYWLHDQYHIDIAVPPQASLPEPEYGQAYPLVSILVPARNEERNIRRCVEAILAQDYPSFECIVLDDRSTDATPAILAELSARDDRLVVLFGAELPSGWAGKPHALHQAQLESSGDWLLFIDADTFLAPGAVSAVMAAAHEAHADLFTIMTRQLMGSFWEKTVLPLVMTALSVGFSPRKVNDPDQRDAIANGQFILVKRAVYDAVGGHEKLKDRIVEDKALAEQVKWNGYSLVVADGQQVASTRMYTSLPEMWEGWTKNIYLGLSDRPGLMALGAFGALLALMAAFALPAWPLIGVTLYSQQGGWMPLVIIAQSLVLWGYLIFIRIRASRAMGISGWWAFSTPLGAGVFAAMMLASTWKVLSGHGVSWKGRKYNSR